MHSRQRSPRARRRAVPGAIRFGTLAVMVAVVGTAPAARAQIGDSTRRPVAIPRTVLDSGRTPDTTQGPKPALRPPLSPGRAFAESFLLPGYSQTVLGRPKAAALFIAFEAVAVTMLRQAQLDLRQARNAGSDGVVSTWWNPATGQAGPVIVASPYDSTLVRSRRAHVEDWIAAIVANHLFAGLDAYVAANLWDLPAELAVRPTPAGADVGIRIRVP